MTEQAERQPGASRKAFHAAFARSLRAEVESGRVSLDGVQSGESRSALALILNLARQLDGDMAAAVADGLYEPPTDEPVATAAAARLIAVTGYSNLDFPASFVVDLYASWGLEGLYDRWVKGPVWRMSHHSPGSGADLADLPADTPPGAAQRAVSLMGSAFTYAAALAAPDAEAQHHAGRHDGYRAAYDVLRELRAALAGGDRLPEERLRAQERQACERLAWVFDNALGDDRVARDMAAHLRHVPRMPGDPSQMLATLTVADLPAIERLARLCAHVAAAPPADPLELFMTATVGTQARMADDFLRSGAEPDLPEDILAPPVLDAGALAIARILGDLEGETLTSAAFIVDTAHAFARDLLAEHASGSGDDAERAALAAASRACHARPCTLAPGVIGLSTQSAT